jgi:transposase-like protein
MVVARARVGRAEWEKRVQRWQDSGLTSKEFAAKLGISAATLAYWKWRLKRERGEGAGDGRQTKASKQRPRRKRVTAALARDESSLVVVQAAPADARIEIELVDGKRLRVPSAFDTDALRRIVATLEGGA